MGETGGSQGREKDGGEGERSDGATDSGHERMTRGRGSERD